MTEGIQSMVFATLERNEWRRRVEESERRVEESERQLEESERRVKEGERRVEKERAEKEVAEQRIIDAAGIVIYRKPCQSRES